MKRVGTPILALGLTVAATIFWPMQEFTGGLLIREHHPAQVVWLRYAAHLLLLLAVVLPLQGRSALSTRRPGLQLVRGLCMFGMPAGFIAAVGLVPVPWIWVVFWTMPAVALMGAAVLLRERPSPLAWGVAALAPVAAAAIWQPAPGGLAGTLAALVMGGSLAGYVVLSRILRGEHIAASLFYTAVGAVLPMSLIVWRVWTPVAASSLVPALLTGALSLLILGAFDMALDRARVAFVAPLIPLVLFWEVVLASVRHTTLPSTGEWVGGLLVVGAAVATLLGGGLRGGGSGAEGRDPGADPGSGGLALGGVRPRPGREGRA